MRGAICQISLCVFLLTSSAFAQSAPAAPATTAPTTTPTTPVTSPATSAVTPAAPTATPAITPAAPATAPAAPATKPAAPSSAPEILFTFDDGPSLERTPKILDTLDKYHVKAIFFVNGSHWEKDSPRAGAIRALLREISLRGHAVGNHTVNHYFLCGKRGAKVAASEIERNADLIEQVIGIRPELFRTPYGSRCKRLQETFNELGITPIGWDIDPQDWRVKNSKLVRTYIINHLKKLRGRAIVLLHDVHADSVTALPEILAWIEQENINRRAQGETELRIIDYSYLCAPHPIIPPVLNQLGRAIVDSFVPLGMPGYWPVIAAPPWRLLKPAPHAPPVGATTDGSIIPPDAGGQTQR